MRSKQTAEGVHQMLQRFLGTYKKREHGFLLPAVIALGLGISTVSVMALQTVSQNSTTLNNQSYQQFAREAAQAGLTAAISCARAAAISASWTDANPLTPKTDCGIVSQASQNLYLIDTSQYRTTYTVAKPTYQDASNITMLITATGKVEVKAPNGSVISTITKIVRAFGKNEATGGAFTQAGNLSANGDTTCVISQDWPFCWGDNSSGQFGIGKYVANNYSSTPMAVATNTGNVSDPGYSYYVCDVFFIRCLSGHTEWSPPASSAGPSRLMNADGSRKIVTKISVGIGHTCAIAKDNAADTTGATSKAYCWGDNSDGQLGDRSRTTSLVPVAVDTRTGWTDPGYCRTSAPLLGCIDYVNPVVNPTSGLNGKIVTDISAGDAFTCAIAKDNAADTTGATSKAYCWGDNSKGSLGTNNTTDSGTPTAIYSAAAYTIPGYCAASIPGLGCISYVDPQDIPAADFWGKTVKTLAKVTSKTMCVTDTTNTAYCWGDNSSGQVGDQAYNLSATNSETGPCEGGATDYPPYPGPGTSPIPNVLQPTTVRTGLKFSSLTTTSLDTSAKVVSTSATHPNRMYWWGGADPMRTSTHRSRELCGSTGGQSGAGVNKYEGTSTATYRWNSTGPTGPLYNAASPPPNGQQLGITAGSARTGLFCVVRSTGQVYCDGHDSVTSGQTGNGQTCDVGDCPGMQAVVMTEFNTRSIDSIDTGANHACVTASGSTFCWGLNNKGQVGDGTTANRNTPTAVNVSSSALSGGSSSSTNGTTFSHAVVF